MGEEHDLAQQGAGSDALSIRSRREEDVLEVREGLRRGEMGREDVRKELLDVDLAQRALRRGSRRLRVPLLLLLLLLSLHELLLAHRLRLLLSEQLLLLGVHLLSREPLRDELGRGGATRRGEVLAQGGELLGGEIADVERRAWHRGRRRRTGRHP